MNPPVLRRAVADLETARGGPAEPVIHYELLDAASGTLLRWGSTTSLDTIVESASQARADLAGRPIHVRQLPEPSWAANAKQSQSAVGIEPAYAPTASARQRTTCCAPSKTPAPPTSPGTDSAKQPPPK